MKKRNKSVNSKKEPANVTVQLESILRKPKYASFIEEIQQKIESAPNYLDDHWEETFRRTLSVLAQTGDLKNTQPSEEDVETALMAIVVGRSR